jgi:hypothetical protein
MILSDTPGDDRSSVVRRPYRGQSFQVYQPSLPKIHSEDKSESLDHLGIQAESGEELRGIYARLHKAGGNIVEQGQTACCYAKSEKSWIDDPAGISWETFHTTGESTDYGDGSGEHVARVAHEKSCCAPAPKITEPAAACGCPAARPLRAEDAERIAGGLAKAGLLS